VIIGLWPVGMSVQRMLFFTDLLNVNPGDFVIGTNEMSSNGTWTICGQSEKSNKSVCFNYTPQDGLYNWAYEVLEAYSVDSECNLYPPSGVVTFDQIVLETQGKKVSPKWTRMTKDNECNEHTVVISPTSVQIRFNTS